MVLAFGLIALPFVPGDLPRAWTAVTFNLGFVALVSVYVFGADTYTNDGRSRWATRGGADHTLYVVAVMVASACVALFALLAARGSRGWIVRPALFLSGAANLVLGFVLILAFDNN